MILYVGDEMIDLYPGTQIFYTVQRTNIGSLTSRLVSHSTDFTAPWTERNEIIFGFAKHEESPDPKIYSLRECKMIDDGVELSKGAVLYITQSEDLSFKLKIFESVFDFFISVNSLKLSDVEPIEDSAWNSSDIDDARTNTEGILSALINWGIPIYRSVTFMPSFFYHTLIKAVLEFTGYELEGDILTDTRFTDLIVPYGRSEFEYPETYFRQFDFYNPRNADDPKTDQTTSPTIVFGQNVTVYQHGTYFARVSVGGITWNTANTLYVQLVKNGDVVASVVLARNPAPGGSVELEWKGFQDNGDAFNFIIVSDVASSGADYTIVGGAGASSYMKFTTDGIVNRNMVNWNQLMPDITCSDLLKDFFTRFGIIPDLVDNTLVLKTMEEILTDISGAVDWSSKLVNVKRKVIKFKSDYAQVNEFSYADLVKDPTLGMGTIEVANNTLDARKTIYKSIFGNSNTMQFFGWNLAVIPVFQEMIIDSYDDFSIGREVNSADNIIQDDEDTAIIVDFGTFNLTVDALDIGSRVMIRNEGNGIVTLVEGVGVNLPGGSFDIPSGYYAIMSWVTDDTPEIYLYLIEEIADFFQAPGIRLLTLKEVTSESSITFDSVARSDYKIGYFVDSTLDKDTGFQYFLDQFYISLEEALQKNKVPNKEYKLVQQDIYDYSPQRMMYDGQGYYLINKINNFNSSKVSKVDVFKVL